MLQPRGPLAVVLGCPLDQEGGLLYCRLRISQLFAFRTSEDNGLFLVQKPVEVIRNEIDHVAFVLILERHLNLIDHFLHNRGIHSIIRRISHPLELNVGAFEPIPKSIRFKTFYIKVRRIAQLFPFRCNTRPLKWLEKYLHYSNIFGFNLLICHVIRIFSKILHKILSQCFNELLHLIIRHLSPILLLHEGFLDLFFSLSDALYTTEIIAGISAIGRLPLIYLYLPSYGISK